MFDIPLADSSLASVFEYFDQVRLGHIRQVHAFREAILLYGDGTPRPPSRKRVAALRLEIEIAALKTLVAA